MTETTQTLTCECGHEPELHDRFGCAAFLGAFEQTRNVPEYCGCARMRASGRIEEIALRQPGIVAEVRIRERHGSAIAVCESPPALELGGSSQQVLEALTSRLRALIEPSRKELQRLRVVVETPDERVIRIVRLR